MLKKLSISLMIIFMCFSSLNFTNAKADTITNQDLTIEKKVLTSEKEVLEYAKKYNLPLESEGKKISEIILNTDTNAVNQINSANIQISPRIGDVCEKLYPYEGYNTNRIAWSTSGTGPGTLSNTVSKTTSSEIFGQFTGKAEVVEATVGFKIGESTTCTSSYSVTLASGEYARIVGYFRYKGYFIKYYTWGGLNYVGTYEVGRPIGIDFIVYK
ncbi:MAG: hypothetical protein KH415_23265 [Clostridium sp.]|nr:hypothetical protein [Clostridium sp.]